MNLKEIVRCAEIINKGEKVFTDSEQVKNDIAKWYGQWGTKIESEKDSKGFWLWNPEKI